MSSTTSDIPNILENKVQDELKHSENEALPLEVKDQTSALNVIIQYVTIAQKRGVFSIQESAHIWEGIKMFIVQKQS